MDGLLPRTTLREGKVGACAGITAGRLAPVPDWVETVWNRLISALRPSDQPTTCADWPPTLYVLAEDEINAFSGPDMRGDKLRLDGQNRYYPVTIITQALLDKVVLSQPDRLALVLGHEIGHHVLGHVAQTVRSAVAGKLPAQSIAGLAYGRQQEFDSDSFGSQLMLRAGYSLNRGREAFRELRRIDKDDSSFEALGADHPAMSERLARLDTNQKSLWTAMGAFESGALLLLLQQFEAAASCFEAVVKEFPKAGDAWANLGYARLMQYCDALTAADVRGFATRDKVGQLAVTGFYERPKWLEAKVRGARSGTPLWQESVRALETAARLDPTLILPKAWLGAASLVRPGGADVRTGYARLKEAATAAEAERRQPEAKRQLSEDAFSSVQVNLACAAAALGKDAEAQNLLMRVGLRELTDSVARPLFYNAAWLLSRSRTRPDRDRARQMLETYLSEESESSLYYPLARERYDALCKQDKIRVGRINRSGPVLRGVATYAITPTTAVSLLESEAVVRARLKAAGITLGEPVSVSGKLVQRLPLKNRDTELLLGDGKVIAVRLIGPKAAPVIAKGSGIGSGSVSLTVGMSLDEVEEKLTPTLRAARRRPTAVRLFPGQAPYLFIPFLFIGMLPDADVKKLDEIVLALPPLG